MLFWVVSGQQITRKLPKEQRWHTDRNESLDEKYIINVCYTANWSAKGIKIRYK